MKRTLMLATGMAVLSSAIYLGSTLSAQQPGTAPQAAPPAAPQTKIALVNLNYVLKNYSKFVAFQGEVKGVLTKYQQVDQDLATRLETKKKEASNPTLTPQQKEAIEKEFKKLTRDRQDNGEQGKTVLSDKSDEGMKTLYSEVSNAAQVYARARGIDLVMHYNDALDPSEMLSAPNVARKLQAGACIPLFITPGMDISPQIVQMLNTAYTNNMQRAPAAGTAPTGTPTPR